MGRNGMPGGLAKCVLACVGISGAILAMGLGINFLLVLGWEELMSLVVL